MTEPVAGGGSGVATQERSRVTTPLLTLITQESLDEDYRTVAVRRESGDLSPAPSQHRTHWVAAAVVAVFGLLTTVAAVQTSRNADVTDAGRATLIQQIKQRKGAVEDRQAQIADLRRENFAAEGDLAQLSATSQTESDRVRRLQERTGYAPVRGPGVRITVANRPDADPADQVRDEDLAKLVDGLWGAGAEAIAINRQRLTVLSPIRNSGPAIHVNTRPLTAPYVIEAIGDPDTLQADLLATTHGAEFFNIAAQLGFRRSMQNVDELNLPAARLRHLTSVRVGSAADERNQEEGQP